MPYKIGDKVWMATTDRIAREVTCPDCCGKKALTIVMGDGSHISIDCAGCATGYDKPRGTIIIYEVTTAVRSLIIEGMDIMPDRTEYKYGISGGDGCYTYHIAKEEDLFDSEAQAQVRASQLRNDKQEEEEHRLNSLKHDAKRTWAWNATYHRRELKRAEEQVHYHRAKLNVASAKAKTTDEQKGARNGQVSDMGRRLRENNR